MDKTTDVVLHVSANPILLGGNLSQLIQVFFNLLHDLVFVFSFSEWDDRWDIVGSHHATQISLQPYIWGLNISNEWGELLVVLNQHLKSCFLQLCLWLHLLYQSKRCPFVSHFPFLHGGVGSLYIPMSLDKFLTLLLRTMQADKCLMYGHELLIEVLHGLSKCWYFTKYCCSHFPQVDLCGDYVLRWCAKMFYLLLGNLQILY